MDFLSWPFRCRISYCKNKEIKYWISYIDGFHNIAIYDNWVLTSNGYNSKAFYLLKLLEDNKTEIKCSFYLFDENDNPLNESDVKMRNDIICFRDDYKLDITNLRELLK